MVYTVSSVAFYFVAFYLTKHRQAVFWDMNLQVLFFLFSRLAVDGPFGTSSTVSAL